MSDDKITRVIREVPPDPAGGGDAGDEALKQARWDRRLEAARARRAQVLAERRARGEAQGKTLLSRKPWEDETAPQPATRVSPQTVQRPALRLVETAGTSPAPFDGAAPVGGVEAAVAAKARTRDERRAAAAVFEPLAAEEPSPRPAGARRRRIWPAALIGSVAVGGLAALGLLVATPAPDRGPETAPAAAVTGNAVAETEAVDPPAPDAPVEAAPAVTAALAPPTGDAAPEVPAADAAPAEEAAPAAAPVEPAEAPAPAEPVLDAPRPIDMARLEAIALAAPAAAVDATAALPGQSETPGPRTLPPPPLLAPAAADPALSGIGVRAQVAAPSLASGPAVTRAAEASDVATPAAAATRIAGAEAPRLAPPSQDTLAAMPAPLAAVAQVGEAAVLPAAPESAAEPDLQLPAVLAAVARPSSTEAPAASEAGSAPRVDAAPPAALPAPEAEVATEVAAAPEPEPAPAPEPAVEAAAEPAEEPAEVAEAAAESPAPPRVDAVLVSILAPRDTAPERVAEAAGTIGGLGYTSREPAEVGVTIRQTQVRYYHPEDAAAAELVAAAVGGTARDFTDFRPQPPDGTVEVWLEGEPTPAPEPVRAVAPVRAAPAPAPAPPPPPQPSGYCWRGEPGTPGAIRVPIVDGRCAWP